MSNTNDEILRGLQEVRVSKDDLLRVIKENRTKHAQQYDESYTGWKVEVLKHLENDLKRKKKAYRDMLKQHKKIIADAERAMKRVQGGDFKTDENLFSVVKKPSHHMEDYNGAIKKLELSLDKELELSSGDFNQFVMDQWLWKQDFTSTWSARSATLSAYNNSMFDPVGSSAEGAYFATADVSPALFTTGSITTALLDGTLTD